MALGACACDQRLPNGTKRVLQRLVTTQSLKGVAIEKLAPGEQVAIDRTQFAFIADRLSALGDRRDLMFDQRRGFHLFQVIVGRGRKQGG
ncbi:hypothetical protein ABIA22_004670 [Sinorhizobium fredii]